MPFPATAAGGAPGTGGSDISVRRRWYEESSGGVQFNGVPGDQLITPVGDPRTLVAGPNPNLVGTGWTWMKNFAFHATSELSTQQPNAFVDFWFQGYEVQLFGSKGWDHGSFTVTLDFGVPVTVNGHCCAAAADGLTGGILPQQILWKGAGLDPDVQHYVRITNGAPGPLGNTFAFDAFLVFQDPPTIAFTTNTQPTSTLMTPSSAAPTTTRFPAGGSEYTNSKGQVQAPVAPPPASTAASSAERIPRGGKRLSWANKLMFGLALGVAVQALL